jgi:NAD-dependent DNA ligase
MRHTLFNRTAWCEGAANRKNVPLMTVLNTYGGKIMIAGKSFAFTGDFATMTPEHARETVLSKGGSVPSSVTKALDYLVVGNIESPLINTGGGKPGKKLLTAQELNERGANIQIITEGEFIDMTQMSA